jgi:hypothetical protein
LLKFLVSTTNKLLRVSEAGELAVVGGHAWLR